MEKTKEPGRLGKFFNLLTEEFVPEPTEEELAAEKEAKAAKKQENLTKKEEEKLAKEEAKKAKAEEKAAADRVKQEAAAQKKKRSLPGKRRRRQSLQRRNQRNVFHPRRSRLRLLLALRWAVRSSWRQMSCPRRDFSRRQKMHTMTGITRQYMRRPMAWSLMTARTKV